GLVAEEVEVAHERLVQPAAEEGGVAVDFAGLQEEVASGLPRGQVLLLLGRRAVAAALDVLPELEAEVVRVQLPGDGPHHLVVAHDELEVQLLRQLEGVQDPLVPEARPALVHDLGLDLRDEVLRLLVDDGEQVLLPLLQERVVVADEEEQVLVGRGRDALQVRLGGLLAPVDALEGVLARGCDRDQALALGLLGELLDREVAAALERERVGRVEEGLHLLEADRRRVDVVTHAVGMRLEGADLELLREAVEAELGHLLADAGVPVLEVRERVGGHRYAPCSRPRSLARKALNEGQMSSLRSMRTVWKLSASRRRKMLSIELS